jgi:hypothetical protein
MIKSARNQNVYSCNGELVNMDDWEKRGTEVGSKAIALYELGVAVGGLEERHVRHRAASVAEGRLHHLIWK